MKINDLEGLFTHQLKDAYGAEKALVKALPKMAKAASHDDLRQVFEEHAQESHGQMERLEKLFEDMEATTRGAKCPAMDGMIEETKELMDTVTESDVLDSALICSAQRTEHYEIAVYGCLRALAEQLGKSDVAGQLQGILDEEKRANEKLNSLALGHINEEAMAHSGSGNGRER